MSSQADEPLVSLSNENSQLQRELKQVRAELEEFTYSVSHDLRASLRHVTAYVQIIQEDLEGQVSSEILGHLTTVRQAAQTMSRQIEALGSLSRLGRVELQLAAFNLNDLVNKVIDDMAPTPDGAPLAWHVAADVPLLWGDAALIQQVLAELLSNAVKFTKNEPHATVGLSWALNENRHCVVTVSDNGAGFNPQHQAKLFHAFQRLHSSRDFEGLGMGLAQCRKIMARLGGDIWADGEVNGGCRVSFTLPLAHSRS
jgi:two-component system OmpR family sensor kinase